ncbi:MAG: tRNA lysidine(34) synthetase TilS [Bacteroidia bacterium]|nr:tRNA lysidine(34) synthetase TilS [Bacteroidia bacterium]
MDTPGFQIFFQIIDLYPDFKIPRTPHIACLDWERLRFPLSLRKWKPGDRFYPLGMQQAKKVSDFLIDLKIPRMLKENVYVLCCQEEIAWVVGYRPDDRYKITADTKKVYQIEVNHQEVFRSETDGL